MTLLQSSCSSTAKRSRRLNTSNPSKLSADTRRKLCKFLMLPLEIHDEIFTLLADDRYTTAFLSVTCAWMLSIGEKHISRYAQLNVPRCRDCRLICIGSYCKYADLLSTLFSDTEKDTIEGRIAADEDPNTMETTRASVALRYLGRSKHYFKADSESDVKSHLRHGVFPSLHPYPHLLAARPDLPETHWLAIGAPALPEHTDVDAADMQRCIDVLAVSYPERDDWVVAKVSLGESCVRARCTRSTRTSSSGGIRSARSTSATSSCRAYVVSPDPEIRMDYEGPWAGDLFRITTLDRLPVPERASAWTDVTAAVCEELTAIWASSNSWAAWLDSPMSYSSHGEPRCLVFVPSPWSMGLTDALQVATTLSTSSKSALVQVSRSAFEQQCSS